MRFGEAQFLATFLPRGKVEEEAVRVYCTFFMTKINVAEWKNKFPRRETSRRKEVHISFLMP